MSKKTLIIVICSIIALLGIGGGVIAVVNSGNNKHEHNYVTKTYAATCTQDGYTEKVCECGDTIKEVTSNATGHKESEVIIDSAATCSEEGHGYVECSVCHTKLRDVTVQKTAHLRQEKVRRAELSEGADNKLTIFDETVCSDCNAVINQTAYPVTFASKTFSYDGQSHQSEMTVEGLPDGYGYSLSGSENEVKPDTYSVSAIITFAGEAVSNGVLTTTYNIVKDGKYHDVLFDFEDGSGHEDYSVVVRDGDTIPSDKLPQVEERKGYNPFGGFDVNAGIKKDETVSVTYTLIEYTINYDLNLSGAINTNEIKYDVETEVILYDAFSNDIAYSFDGWYTDETYAVKVTKIETGTTGDQYFYAKWSPANFFVNFYCNSNDTADYQGTYNVETGVVPENEPQKAHCTFGGWYVDAELTEKADLTPGKLKGNINLYAKWKVATYTVGYELNGGNFNEGETPAIFYEYGSASVTLLNPSKNGYKFDGWYKESTYKTKVTEIDTNSDGNKTYYAKWQAVEYEITYSIEEAEFDTDLKTTYTIEDEVTLPVPKDNRKGYKFIGWRKPFETEYITVISKGTTGNIKLEGVWNLVEYTITYDYDGGKVTDDNPKSFTVLMQVEVVYKPTKQYYEFIGWSGTGITGLTENILIEKGNVGNREYKANWKLKEYTIEYKTDYGSNNPSNPTTYTVESKEIVFSDPITDGHIFSGWYTVIDNKEVKITSISAGSFGDIEVYAKWEHIPSGDWIIDSEPSCKTEGEKHKICSVCNKNCLYTSISVDTTVHNNVKQRKDNIVSATCSSEGSYDLIDYCEDCNTTINETHVTLGKTAHSFDTSGKCLYCDAKQSNELKYEKCTDLDGYQLVGIGTCTDSTLIIPSSYEGEPVLRIATKAFYENTKIKGVEMPDTITEIDENAFYGCSNLTNVKLSAKLEKIGRRAFYNCALLSKIVFPDTLTSIGIEAFLGNGFTSIEIPDNVTSIGTAAFRACENLSSVKLSNNSEYKYIAKQMFRACTNLEEFDIPDNIIGIGSEAFYATGLKKVVIPDSVTSVEQSAFQDCGNVESIVVGEGLKEIQNCAFKVGSKLKTVTWNAKFCTTNTNAKTAAFFPAVKCDFTFGDGVEHIPSQLLYSCNWLENITIPDSVISIGNNVFENTKWYKNQSDGLIYAGKVLYKYKGTMPENTLITVKEGTLGIADSAFTGCKTLTGIIVPESVKSIGSQIFNNCTSLTAVYISGDDSQAQLFESASSAMVYKYSQTKPVNDGNYWYYAEDGVTPVIWSKETV